MNSNEYEQAYSMIITKLAGLFTLWIYVELSVRSLTQRQYKCRKRSMCLTHGGHVNTEV